MTIIKKLKEHIVLIEKKIEDIKALIDKNPDDFSLMLEFETYNNQLKDLNNQLYQENLKREKEIVELRLKGEKARFGSIPLRVVGGITNHFAQSIFNISKYLEYGNKGGKKREAIINDTIDLRLEGIGTGSTIFYLSGRTTPDLFGYSILQEALKKTFDTFNSENADEIIECVENIGAKSAKSISHFLSELSKDELEVDISWKSPEGDMQLWKGENEKIVSLHQTLTTIKISDPVDSNFKGELITISSKGRFEILLDDDTSIHGHFSNDLLERMKEFHIGDSCKGVVSKSTIYNPITHKEKYQYDLKKICYSD
jgi:hypothetical protein